VEAPGLIHRSLAELSDLLNDAWIDFTMGKWMVHIEPADVYEPRVMPREMRIGVAVRSSK